MSEVRYPPVVDEKTGIVVWSSRQLRAEETRELGFESEAHRSWHERLQYLFTLMYDSHPAYTNVEMFKLTDLYWDVHCAIREGTPVPSLL